MLHGGQWYTSRLWFYYADPEEATVKQLAITLTRDAYVVADESKFSEVTFARITDLKDAMIITNAIDKEIQSQYERETTIKVVRHDTYSYVKSISRLHC